MIPLLLALAGPAAAQEWHTLAGADARASSFLKSNWNKYEENYHPSYALDDDPATAWVEGVPGTGEGQVLEWSISALSSARAVKVSVRNGYQKSEALLAANAAPKDVEISLLDGGGAAVTTEKATLQKAMGWQEVTLHPPKSAAFSGVRITVLSTWAGKKYQDTVISDVAVSVDSDVPYNAAAEDAKRRRLAEWIQGRRETAAYFASLPAEYPFAGTHGEYVRLADGETCVATKVAAEMKPYWDAYDHIRGSGAPWYKRTVATPVVAPEGFALEEDVVAMLDASRVTWFEATAETAGSQKGDPDLQEVRSWSNDRVEWATPPVPALVYSWTRVRGVERTPYDNRREWLVAYDTDGKAAWVMSVWSSPEDGRADLVFVFHRDTSGRIDRVDSSMYDHEDGQWDEDGPRCLLDRTTFSP